MRREGASEQPAIPAVVAVRVPMRFRKYGGAKQIIAPCGTTVSSTPSQPDTTLVKALARAFRWRKLLEDGVHATVSDLSKAEKINPSYVSRVLRLTLLAPQIVESILNGTNDPMLTLPRLMKPFPEQWVSQEVSFGRVAR